MYIAILGITITAMCIIIPLLIERVRSEREYRQRYTGERHMAKTVKDVKASVDSLFSDSSCSQEETRERLAEIVEHIEMCLESLGG